MSAKLALGGQDKNNQSIYSLLVTKKGYAWVLTVTSITILIFYWTQHLPPNAQVYSQELYQTFKTQQKPFVESCRHLTQSI